jgi:predicted anti-sigma-YlaC factor YlaD
MDCTTAREAISAILDGEDPGTSQTAVDAHLAHCAACREWRDAAHEVTRRARLHLESQIQARAGEVLTALQSRTRVRRRRVTMTLARLVLVAVAAAQLALTVPWLLFGHDHSAPEHVAHEMGSFGAALAAGFLVAAWRPRRALGMRTLVGVAAALLVVTAVADLAAGRTSLGDEAPHLVAVAGWLIICYLASVTPPTAEQARRIRMDWLRAHLSSSRRSALFRPASAQPVLQAAARPRLRGHHLHAASDSAACGCAGGRCDCPGCVAPRRAAS